MPTTTARVELAQKALSTYQREHCGVQRWRFPVESEGIGESDIVDLVTDLLLLAVAKGHDPESVVRKAKQHLSAEVGHT